MSRRVFSWVLVWLLAIGVAGAQQGTTEVKGRVIDAQGSAMPGVTVTVRNQETGMFRETLSGDNGAFIASRPRARPLRGDRRAPGVQEVQPSRPAARSGRARRRSTSRWRSAAWRRSLTVTAETPLVDVTSKEIGGNITSETLIQLPSVNGNFIGFIGLLPGIVPSISTESFGSDSISVNGQDPRNNNYMVDGGNNNDDVIGQRAGMQARTPIEAIQEFQVITGQYDAEFGRTTGAVINAVIKSGTNTIHGSAFGYFQDSGLTTKDFFAKQRNGAKADTSYQRWGGVIGGPILKDRMHYFGSLERFAIDRANTLGIPDASRPERPADHRRIASGTRSCAPTTSSRRQHTYNVRWLREQSPQLNQIVPTGDGLPDRARRA